MKTIVLRPFKLPGSRSLDRNQGCDIMFTGVRGQDGTTTKVKKGSRLSAESLTKGPMGLRLHNCNDDEVILPKANGIVLMTMTRGYETFASNKAAAKGKSATKSPQTSDNGQAHQSLAHKISTTFARASAELLERVTTQVTVAKFWKPVKTLRLKEDTGYHRRQVVGIPQPE
ncbi:hypothetical protein TWF481_003793 [Arthrobotrys musiformis]|uniref:Uncharacterized protein n=1 Tax=Arthrobotrys musiformis TaxID=47236 RepID=A0AAV9WJN9_9PEZI